MCLLLIMNIFDRLSANKVLIRLYDGTVVHTVASQEENPMVYERCEVRIFFMWPLGLSVGKLRPPLTVR